jgi:hypothetical protein
MTTPDEIRQIADQRLKEAKLLQSQFPEGAYYLAGYCVELYLKARICELLNLPDLFADAEALSTNQPSFSNSQLGKLFKIHDLPKLVLLAGWWTKLENDKAADRTLSGNWAKIILWKETKRYAQIGSISSALASELIEAIDHPQTGFLQWMRKN